MPTALGVATALFVLAGAFHVFIGVATPLSIRQHWTPSTVIYTAEADRAIFGRPPEAVRADPDVAKLREIVLGMVSGLLVALGTLEIALAWFGVRQGQTWAVWALAAAAVLSAAFWTMGHALWIRAGAPGGLGALQPFQWVPLVLTAPAVFLALRT